MKVVRGRPRPFHHHFNTKIQYRVKMTSSIETNKYKDKVDERPIRVDHSLMGRRESEGSSVDGVSHEDISEFWGGSGGCVLLNFTTERGDAVSHPSFGEEAVRDLCARVLGKLYKNISRLNQTDFLIEFEASDNPTLFAIKLGNTHTWLGMELQMDAHIGTAMTLKKVSKQREEAQDIVDNAKVMPDKNIISSLEKQKVKKTSEEDSTGKEDTMLKVLESMSQKIEDLEKTAKENHTATSIPNIRGQDFWTPSTSTLIDQPQRQDGVYLMEQLPRVGYFSGEKPTPKGEIDFKTWKSDVTGNLQNYPELSLRPGIRSSLRGNAKELLEGLPTGTTVREIVDMLTRQYGTVESSDQLLATFYQLLQNKGEEVANFVTRLVGTLNKIQKRLPPLGTLR